MIFIYYNISQWSLKNQTLTELSFATAAACRKKKKAVESSHTYLLLDIYFYTLCVTLLVYSIAI